MTAWIGLGSNIGDGREEIRRALARLSEHPDLKLLRRSSIWRTAPWGRQDQPDFHNAVAEFATGLDARSLLDVLLATETDLGRVRTGSRWGPRRIDLDLLLLGNSECDEPGLRLPHPRMHLRAFVLAPLAELEPDLAIPGQGTVAACLRRLGEQEVERIDDAT